jgi:RHS repeat-associated protein
MQHAKNRTASGKVDGTFNPSGRLETVSQSKLNNSSVNLTTTYTYDAVGNLDTVAQPNGVVTDYDYDGLNRLVKETVKQADGDKLFEQDYILLANGQRAQVIEKRYDGTSSTPFSTTRIAWSYDDEDRLTQELRDEGNDGIQNGGDYTDIYTLDLVGNRTAKEHQTASGTTTTRYTYTIRDQLEWEGLDADDDGVIDLATRRTYTYDANGSQETVTDSSKPAGSRITTYTWDLRNRLAGINAPGTADDVTYTYDSNGVRISETTAGSTTYFLNDPNNPTGYTKAIEEKSAANGAPTRSYVLGNKVEAQSDSTNGTLYFLTDGHGSTRALTNSSGAVVSGTTYDYDAYGQPLNFMAEDAKTNWLFAGDGVYDAASGWTYHLARWRDGFRFTSFDSFEADPSSPADLHKYAYAGANPTILSDPTGHFSVAELASTGTVRNIVESGIGRIQQMANVYFRVQRFVDFVDEVRGIFNLVYSGQLTQIIWEQVKQVPLTEGYGRWTFTGADVARSLGDAASRIGSWVTSWTAEMLKFGATTELQSLFINFPIPASGLAFRQQFVVTNLHVGKLELPLKLVFGKANNDHGNSLFGFGMETRRHGSQTDVLRQMFRVDVNPFASSHPNPSVEWDAWQDAPFHYHVLPLFTQSLQ